MLEDRTAERPPDPNEEPRPTMEARQETPASTGGAGSDDIDIVDFQSMQSFPASDAPAWPVVRSEPALNGAREQQSTETGKPDETGSGDTMGQGQ